VSMVALSAALVVLFELSVLVAWSHDRRLARRRAEQGWEDLGPDEAAPLNHRVEPVADPPQYDEAT